MRERTYLRAVSEYVLQHPRSFNMIIYDIPIRVFMFPECLVENGLRA
jgi:hypothetical protein